MGINLYILEPDLEDDDEHISTSWVVSEKEDFSEILVYSLEDKINKLGIYFDIRVTSDITYYAKCKIYTKNNGASTWSNVTVNTLDNSNKLLELIDIPSTINPPTIKTDFDYNNHPVGLFNIYADNFDIVGDATHIATTWIIEDINSRVVYLNFKDKFNLNKIPTHLHLETNSIYTIRVMFHGSNNDVSQFSSLTIKTYDETLFYNLEHKGEVSKEQIYDTLIEPKNGLEHIYVKFHTMNETIEKEYDTNLTNRYHFFPIGITICEFYLTNEDKSVMLGPVYYNVLNNNSDCLSSFPLGLPSTLGDCLDYRFLPLEIPFLLNNEINDSIDKIPLPSTLIYELKECDT